MLFKERNTLTRRTIGSIPVILQNRSIITKPTVYTIIIYTSRGKIDFAGNYYCYFFAFRKLYYTIFLISAIVETFFFNKKSNLTFVTALSVCRVSYRQ